MHSRAWQDSASSSPPPSALPLMAATTGLPSFSIRRRHAFIASSSWKNVAASSGRTAIRARRSPPAKNVLLAEVKMTPRICSRSPSSRTTIARRSAWNAAFIVLTGWSGASRSSVTTPWASFS
jgi:hypothetical protein